MFRDSMREAGAGAQPPEFDPTRPVSTGWQRVLEKIAERWADARPRVAEAKTGIYWRQTRGANDSPPD